MAAKTSWHRYGTKLRHYHLITPMHSEPSTCSAASSCVILSETRPRRSVWSRPHSLGTFFSQRLWTFMSHAAPTSQSVDLFIYRDNTSHDNYNRIVTQRGWIGSRVVSGLDSGAEGPGFKSQPRRCRVTVLGKPFTPNVPLFTKQRNW